MPKEDYRRLQEVAQRLRNSEPPFFRGNHIGSVEAWVRDAGKCQYCGRYLYDSYAVLGDSDTDHILPRSKYELFKHEARNLVACCIECNKIKGDWDPATEATGQPELEIKTLADLETHRDELINRTREHIQRTPDKWQALFEKARRNFEDAVAEYRRANLEAKSA